MFAGMKDYLRGQLDQIRSAGLYKGQRVLESPQGPKVRVAGRTVLNLCANNYLNLAADPRVTAAARESLDRWGYGLASVRFICGTTTIHQELERSIAGFLGTDDAILYTSCFDANGGLFETLLGEDDAVISDELNHASIIDGIRLCKARRLRYRHADMADLESQLKQAASSRFRMIATDGVFSMDGEVAKLQDICELADRYDAVVMVDDSHAVGFWGPTGKGTHESCGVAGRVDILTGTLGKALGGASGGYTAARKEIVETLRQRSRPYLFSNTLPPSIVAGSLAAIDLLKSSDALRATLMANTRRFRQGMADRGFNIPPGEHPIVPIMLGDAAIAQRMSAALLDEGVYVIGFVYPVVPQGKARIRVQVSAGHSDGDLDEAMDAFARVKAAMNI